YIRYFYCMKKLLLACMVLALVLGANPWEIPTVHAQSNSKLYSQAYFDNLKQPGNAEWQSILSYDTQYLSQVIGGGYAEWGYRTALEDYGIGYTVLKDSAVQADQQLADKFAQK